MESLNFKPVELFVVRGCKGYYRKIENANNKSAQLSNREVITKTDLYQDSEGNLYKIKCIGKSVDDDGRVADEILKSIKTNLKPEDIEFLKSNKIK